MATFLTRLVENQIEPVCQKYVELESIQNPAIWVLDGWAYP